MKTYPRQSYFAEPTKVTLNGHGLASLPGSVSNAPNISEALIGLTGVPTLSANAGMTASFFFAAI